MDWVVLLGPSIASVLILLSVYLWQGRPKDERPVRAHIDDIPFRPDRIRRTDDNHLR